MTIEAETGVPHEPIFPSPDKTVLSGQEYMALFWPDRQMPIIDASNVTIKTIVYEGEKPETIIEINLSSEEHSSFEIDASICTRENVYSEEEPQKKFRINLSRKENSPWEYVHWDYKSRIVEDEITGKRYIAAKMEARDKRGTTRFEVVFRWSKEVEERKEPEQRGRRHQFVGLG